MKRCQKNMQPLSDDAEKTLSSLKYHITKITTLGLLLRPGVYDRFVLFEPAMLIEALCIYEL